MKKYDVYFRGERLFYDVLAASPKWAAVCIAHELRLLRKQYLADGTLKEGEELTSRLDFKEVK